MGMNPLSKVQDFIHPEFNEFTEYSNVIPNTTYPIKLPSITKFKCFEYISYFTYICV